MPITALPTPPSRQDPANFATRADAFLGALPTFAIEANSTAADVNASQSAATVSAAAAAASETAAAASAAAASASAATAASASGATAWVSGTTYALGAVVYSTVTGRTYRRIVAGAGTTDPSADTTNWRVLALDMDTGYPTIRPSLNLDFANTKALDPRITFTRASEGRYYDGKTVAKAEENLLLRSQELDDAAWGGVGVTVTADTSAAPNGTTTAETLAATAGGTTHYTQQSASTGAGAFTASFFIKAGTSNFAAIRIATDAGANRYGVVVDLSLGTVTTTLTSGSPTATSNSITAAGNGWYRVTATATNTSGAVFAGVALSDSGSPANSAGFPSFSAAGTETILIWGAQLEQRSSVTDYTSTTTQPITKYIPVLQTAAANVARFDHNPVTGESLGLLIEEQRTNLLLYSAQLSGSGWLTSRSSFSLNQLVSPDGTVSASRWTEISSAGSSYIYLSSHTFNAGVTYTVSVYAKQYFGQKLQLQFSTVNGFATTVVSTFNLDTGTVESGLGKITPVGNGWYRCSLTATCTTTTTSNWICFQLASDFANAAYGIYIWGAQLEAGAFPTSYIPTAASQVTRQTDEATMIGANFSPWFSAPGGTVYSEATTFGLIDVLANNRRHLWSLSQGTPISSNGVSAFVNQGFASGIARANTDTITTLTSISSASIANGALLKYALAYDGATISRSINTAAGSQARQMVAGTFDRLGLGSEAANTSRMLNGHIRKLSYYPSRLTDAQLQALTT